MFQTCSSLVQGSAYPGQNGPNHIKRDSEVLVIARVKEGRPWPAVRCSYPLVRPNEAVPAAIFRFGGADEGTAQVRAVGCKAVGEEEFQPGWQSREISASRHAEPFSVNKSPDATGGSANFDSVDSCKQKPHGHRLRVAPAMKQPQPKVVRDSKDMTMSAVINRGGGRPSKGLRKYIGFRTQAKTAEDVQMIAAAKGMTVTDYVSSAVDRSLREDLALLDHFAHQEELPIRIAS